jgi:hypothetical protein
MARKHEELIDPNSCLNKARDDEMLFILCGDDRSAPSTVMDWIRHRVEFGQNAPTDGKLQCAGSVAEIMDRERVDREASGAEGKDGTGEAPAQAAGGERRSWWDAMDGQPEAVSLPDMDYRVDAMLEALGKGTAVAGAFTARSRGTVERLLEQIDALRRELAEARDAGKGLDVTQMNR